VELQVAGSALRADGREYPEGSILIRRDQPYSRHVKDLFEVQRYPEGEPPYDVAGWTLPMLFGLRRVEVMEGWEGEVRPALTVDEAVAGFRGGNRRGALSGLDSDTWKRVFAGLAEGETFSWHHDDEDAGFFRTGKSGGEAAVYLGGMPRVGLYTPWSGSMDEGWARWVFDEFGVPYVSVRNEMIRAGSLDDFLDVLVIPSISGRQLDRGRSPGSAPPRYTGGLDPEGSVAVEEFVREGGTVVAMGSSGSWAVELFQLPLAETTRGDQAKEFSCPGSVVRTVPEPSIWTVGLPASLPVFFSRSTAWKIDEEKRKQAAKRHEGEDPPPGPEILLRYAPTRVLLSGYIRKPEVIAGQPAWIRAPYGKGAVHLFGFRPQYRGWSQAAFPLLFRAMLFEGGGG
jgi:hypothetical protein